MGSNKSEKRKPKSAVYRSFWASVVYFHLRLISTKSHKGEMTRNRVGGKTSRGFESHLLRHPKNHPNGWFFFCFLPHFSSHLPLKYCISKIFSTLYFVWQMFPETQIVSYFVEFFCFYVFKSGLVQMFAVRMRIDEVFLSSDNEFIYLYFQIHPFIHLCGYSERKFFR